MALSIDLSTSPRIITVLAPVTTVSAQDLLNEIRDFEDELLPLDEDYLVDAAGKEDLGGGAAVGITLTLRNARVAFEARPGPAWTLCAVNGGNLVAVDALGVPMDAIEPTAYVTVNTQASSSPTIANLEITRLKYLIESLRSTHQGFGSMIFLDPVDGDDALLGDMPETAVATFAQAQALATDGAGDVIVLLASSAGTVTLAESITITKEDLHLRGPGRGFQIQPASGVPITIDANNCSLSGFIVRAPAASTATDCIVVNGKFTRMEKLYVVGTETGTGIGVHFRGGDYHELHGMEIEKCGGDGVKLTDAGLASGAPREVTISKGTIYLNGGHGVNLTGNPGTTTRLNRIRSCTINMNGGSGINIGADVAHTFIAPDVDIFNNTAGEVADAGVDTDDLRLSTQMWDAPAADHEVAGSMGEVLRILRLVNMNRMKINDASKKLEIYEDDGTTVAYRFDLKDLTGAPASSGATERTNRTAGP